MPVAWPACLRGQRMQSGSDYRQLVVMCLGEQPAMIFGCNITGNVAVLCVFLEVQHWLIAPCEKFVPPGPPWAYGAGCRARSGGRNSLPAPMSHVFALCHAALGQPCVFGAVGTRPPLPMLKGRARSGGRNSLPAILARVVQFLRPQRGLCSVFSLGGI